MAIELRQTGCCGMKEIDNLSHVALPADALRDIALPLHITKTTYAIFSGVTKRTAPDHASSRMDDYGRSFADYLLSMGLGNVIQTNEALNLRSGNHLRVWVWQIDRDALHRWMIDKGL